MIPKIIHYCWFGRNPLPEMALKCIESWKKYLPDYEIKQWNEDNFDVNIVPYTSEGYKTKKYAFVSDYARFYTLYHYGGIYLDTDVEVIKSLDEIIRRGAFMAKEIRVGAKDQTLIGINSGLGCGMEPGNQFYKRVLDYYSKSHLYKWNGKRTFQVVELMNKVIDRDSIVEVGDGISKFEDIYIYEPEYFCPKSYFSGQTEMTDKTVCIHHYASSWVKKGKLTFFQKIEIRLSAIFARLVTTIQFMFK